MAMRRKSKYGEMILPDGKYYSLDDHETGLNNNVVVVGTTGSSKTRTVITPNLLECVGSYVVTDPKGNLYKKWGSYMEENGYRVIRLSFVHPEESVHYNPLHYVWTTQQIQQMANTLIYSEGRCQTDPFWDQSAQMLMNSVISLKKEQEPFLRREPNLHDLAELIRVGNRDEENHPSGLDRIFSNWKMRKKSSWAYQQYCSVSAAPPRTWNCIVVEAVARIGALDTKELQKMMAYDEINIPSIGRQKTAVFVEVSDTDRSMDMLINLFFTQALHQLCRYADENCEDSHLPVPVRFFMDDFATNCRIENFDKMISNIRSRKISAVIILQSLAQLEASYGTSASTIVDDCDTLIYMGGNDPSTAQSIACRCNKTMQSVLHMPLRTSWIFRRGSEPFMAQNMELDDYLERIRPKTKRRGSRQRVS